jgi:hypothetical protein
MLPTKFRFIWSCGYRGEHSLESGQSETRIAYGGHVCYRIETKYSSLVWNPSKNQQISEVEQIQRKAARYVFNDYRDRSPGASMEGPL